MRMFAVYQKGEALAFISARAVGLGLADDAAELDAAFHRRENHPGRYPGENEKPPSGGSRGGSSG